MFLQVVVPVLLRFARIHFPRARSVMRSRYGNKNFKMARKLKNLDFQLRKAKLDIKL